MSSQKGKYKEEREIVCKKIKEGIFVYVQLGRKEQGRKKIVCQKMKEDMFMSSYEGN